MTRTAHGPLLRDNNNPSACATSGDKLSRVSAKEKLAHSASILRTVLFTNPFSKFVRYGRPRKTEEVAAINNLWSTFRCSFDLRGGEDRVTEDRPLPEVDPTVTHNREPF